MPMQKSCTPPMNITIQAIDGQPPALTEDGARFRQLRVCHMWQGGGKIRFGVYACSPEDSSFTAVFTQMRLTECQWLAHDGQQPDE